MKLFPSLGKLEYSQESDCPEGSDGIDVDVLESIRHTQINEGGEDNHAVEYVEGVQEKVAEAKSHYFQN